MKHRLGKGGRSTSQDLRRPCCWAGLAASMSPSKAWRGEKLPRHGLGCVGRETHMRCGLRQGPRLACRRPPTYGARRGGRGGRPRRRRGDAASRMPSTSARMPTAAKVFPPSEIYYALTKLPESDRAWGCRLPPVLAACLAAFATGYTHIHDLPDWQTFCVLGGTIAVIVILMIGVLAVPFVPSMSAEAVSRHSTFAAFIIIIILLTALLCFQLSGAYIVVSAISGSLVVGLRGEATWTYRWSSFFYLWYLSSKY